MWPGYRKPENYVVDTGVIAVGGVTEAWGATVGGIQWDPGKVNRQVEFDGRSSEIEGMHRTIRYDAKLTGRVKRGGASSVMTFEPGSESDGSSGSSGNEVTLLDARATWQPGMYLEDVNYIGRQEDGQVMHVHIPRGYVKTYKFATVDNDEMLWDIEIIPVLPSDETNLNKVPFTYRYVPEGS